MKITAIWIIDDNYIVPAYASICSFLNSNDIPVVVVYCSDFQIESTRQNFTDLHSGISFETFETPLDFRNHSQKSTITNRLARMHYAVKYKDEVALLIDADTLFSKEGNLLVKEIRTHFLQGQSSIFGVLDAKIAYRDYLYFKTMDEDGREVAIPHQKQKDVYTYVFGDNWWHHLKGASINNGIIAFHECEAVVKLWKEFYLKGVSHPNVNPGDDQLPLAAAIHKTEQNVVCLPEKFNSKGEIEGEYIVYHALSSAWKMQFYSAYQKEIGVSDFADLAKEVLHMVPVSLLEKFIENLPKAEPYLYKKLNGKFGFKHLYEDIISGIDDGVVVEIGMNKGKSACFMSEIISKYDKNIQFFAYKTDSDDEESLIPFLQLLNGFNLEKHITICEPIEDYSSDNSIENNIDFAFLNLGNRYDELYKSIKFWYSKLKPGGTLAGYDYTSQIGLKYGNACATYDFCETMKLPLRISFNIFIIEKPFVEPSNVNSHLILEELNYPL